MGVSWIFGAMELERSIEIAMWYKLGQLTTFLICMLRSYSVPQHPLCGSNSLQYNHHDKNLCFSTIDSFPFRPGLVLQASQSPEQNVLSHCHQPPVSRSRWKRRRPSLSPEPLWHRCRLCHIFTLVRLHLQPDLIYEVLVVSYWGLHRILPEELWRGLERMEFPVLVQ